MEVQHFTLCASRKCSLDGAERREGSNSWAAQQIDRCISGFSNEVFQHHIDTDLLSIDEVVETIGALANVKLLPDHRTQPRRNSIESKPNLRTSDLDNVVGLSHLKVNFEKFVGRVLAIAGI